MEEAQHRPGKPQPAECSSCSWTAPNLLGNSRRHGNRQDPLCEGTSLPDLLGLRLTGSYIGPRLERLLPRLDAQSLLGHLGVDSLAPGPELECLRDSAAAALALPSLSGRSASHRAAQVAAVHIAREEGLGVTRTARLLGLCARTVDRHRGRDPEPGLIRAARLQMGLREQAGAGTVSPGPLPPA